MDIVRARSLLARKLGSVLLTTAAYGLFGSLAAGQVSTGALLGTVTDEQGQPLAGVQVRIASPPLIGGPSTLMTTSTGQFRFPALPLGSYVLHVERAKFASYREEHIRIGGGSTIERTVELRLAGVAESVVVEGSGSRIDARDPGFASRFGPQDLRAIPSRRAGPSDFLRTAPGVSPTSPSSGTVTTLSVFGSGVNENMFLIDGTNTTCPCNGVMRSEIWRRLHSRSADAIGRGVGGVRQRAGRRVQHRDAVGQQSLPGRHLVLRAGGDPDEPARAAAALRAGDRRVRIRTQQYRDFTANTGGPAIQDRLWFFGGYQYLRDYDSQPGTDPQYPRTYEQNKFFGKLTWQLAPGWQLVQSVHGESWVNADRPTLTMPFETTVRPHATVPAITFGHLTHVMSANTLWDVRVGRFTYNREDEPSAGPPVLPGRVDSVTGFASNAPREFGGLTSPARPSRPAWCTTGPRSSAPVTSSRRACRSSGASTRHPASFRSASGTSTATAIRRRK